MTECYACAKLAELRAENNALRAANDTKATESDVRTLGVDANDASVDTREKILADLEKLTHKWHDYDGNFMRIYNSVAYAQVKELLDRQAAITERHILTHPDERDEQIAELQARVDELNAQLEAAYAKNRSLRTHISKMQEGRHGWHVKGVELEEENAELRAAYDELTAIAAQLCRACGFSTVDASGEVVG